MQIIIAKYSSKTELKSINLIKGKKGGGKRGCKLKTNATGRITYMSIITFKTTELNMSTKR